MGLLAWLGLKSGDAHPNLDALMRDLREALPGDESVLLRYIAIVVVLLGKVVWADGQVTPKEEASLRSMLAHIEGLAPSGVEAVCDALHGKIPAFTEREMELIYGELRGICDGAERKQIMRLLLSVAAVDGRLSESEKRELARISEELGVPFSELETDAPADAIATPAPPTSARGK